MSEKIVSLVRSLADSASERSLVPYSGRDTATVLLLADGAWIPGVRVESASFSLTVPALLNALTTAVALQRDDIVAIVQNRNFSEEEQAFLLLQSAGRFTRQSDDAYVHGNGQDLPTPRDVLPPFLKAAPPAIPEEGIRLTREIARRALVPESNFPVGAVLRDRQGRLIPGVNVEYSEWARILCAERNALGTAVSYGLHELAELYLTCTAAPGCTPCGACRQLLAELAPDIRLWMDCGPEPPLARTPLDLLPDFFGKRIFSRG